MPDKPCSRAKTVTHLGGITAADLLLQEPDLVFAELELALVPPELVDDLLGTAEFSVDTVEGILVLVDTAFDRPKLLHLDEKTAAAWSGTARERAGRVVHVALERHRLDANVLVERHCLGRLLVRADESVAKDVRHSGRDIVVVADQVQREMRLARRDLLGRSEFLLVSVRFPRPNGKAHLGRHLERVDLVERDDCDALTELASLEQLRTDPLVLDDHVVQLAAGADLQRGRALEVLLVQVDQGCNEPLDLGPVEPRLGVRVREVDRRQTRLQMISPLHL